MCVCIWRGCGRGVEPMGKIKKLMKFKFQNSLKEIGISSHSFEFDDNVSYFYSLLVSEALQLCAKDIHTLKLSFVCSKKKPQVWHMYYTVYKLLYHSWNINTIIANIPGLSSAPFLHLWLMRSIVNVNNLVCRCLSFQKCDRIKWFYNALYHLSINIHKLWIRQSFFLSVPWIFITLIVYFFSKMFCRNKN